MHMQHSSCSKSSAPPFGIRLGAPHGIASVGCWTGRALDFEQELGVLKARYLLGHPPPGGPGGRLSYLALGT